jgi:2-polyprenyl-6-hydroxyphenyl methylase / 3-demethylubiquinone-9 3-methyltransferase
MMLGGIEAGRPTNASVDAEEVDRFAARADAWWDAHGSFQALHRFNPARLAFIRSQLMAHFARDRAALRPFTGLTLLDIGCGGGLVAEAMARLGFTVTGIDASAEAIAAARAHGEAAGLRIEYRIAAVESLAAEREQFDAVVALELIEHLADRDLFYQALGRVIRPCGAFVAATLSRTAKSFVLAIVAAEHLLGWLPRGTHDWRKFVRPSELVLDLRRHGLRVTKLAGISLDPRTGEWRISEDLAVNYLAMAVGPERPLRQPQPSVYGTHGI